MQPLDQKAFNPAAGMDSASADVNKIMRLSYGTEIEYQRLAFEASEIWKEWNEELAATTPTSLPQGLSPGDKLWHHSGMLRLSATREYGDFELRTLENMVKDGLRDQQFMCDNLEGMLYPY
jgi:sarcosine oxidase/L-pipecolate oxidase